MNSVDVAKKRGTSRVARFAIMPVFLAFGPVGALAQDGTNPFEDLKAVAVIAACDNPEHILGQAVLREAASEEGIKEVGVAIEISARNSVLSRGTHAVHIHETGACEPCSAAGGHFDPGPFGFTSPDGNHPFHAGDLINIEVDGRGQGTLRTLTSRVTLSPGPLSVFDEDGSAFIIHVDEDTYCPEGEEAGCAGGARAACGVIEPED